MDKKKWIVYCEKKNKELLARIDRSSSFEDCIEKIQSELFVIIENPSKNHQGQNCFLVLINDYPHIAPFNEWKETIQLITLFPSRRYKDEK